MLGPRQTGRGGEQGGEGTTDEEVSDDLNLYVKRRNRTQTVKYSSNLRRTTMVKKSEDDKEEGVPVVPEDDVGVDPLPSKATLSTTREKSVAILLEPNLTPSICVCEVERA